MRLIRLLKAYLMNYRFNLEIPEGNMVRLSCRGKNFAGTATLGLDN
jgi:hypothetical protein